MEPVWRPQEALAASIGALAGCFGPLGMPDSPKVRESQLWVRIAAASLKDRSAWRAVERFQRNRAPLEYFGRLGQDRLGDGQPQRLSSLEIHREVERRGLFHRQVGRLGASEDAIHMLG
jgi:hypothetical protein